MAARLWGQQRPRCGGCGRFMSNGPVSGAFQCKSCNDILWTRDATPWDLYRYQQNLLLPKQQILTFIQKKKATTSRTLKRHFPKIPVSKFVNELFREGRIKIQQSGYAGHSLYHEKLLVPVTVRGMGMGYVGSSGICAQVRRPIP